MRDSDIVIVDGVRTPWCKAGSDFATAGADELARQTMRALLDKLDLDAAKLDEVILGCVIQPVDAMNVGRVAAIRAGVPLSVPAITVHRNCASSMEAITVAVERIRAGRGELYMVGGTENMSQAPLYFNDKGVRFFNKLQRAKTVPQQLRTLLSARPSTFAPRIALMEGLTDKTCGLIMGLTAEKLSREFHITREEQDQFALRSHQRALAANGAETLKSELMPTFAPPKYRAAVEQDNGPRFGQSIESLAKLKPFFDRRYGTVTVGNSCPITDGAVALLVTTAGRAKAEGWQPLGVLDGYAYAGLEPSRMGLGPVFATAKLLDGTGKGLDLFDRVELNEAFAAQVLACGRAFESADFAKRELDRDTALGDLDPDKLNVNGGAIALGHPVGATGGRLVLTLLHELARIDKPYGLATLCVGGGQGAALLLRRPDADPVLNRDKQRAAA